MLEPKLRFTYYLNSLNNLSLSYFLRKDRPNLKELYRLPIYTSYRVRSQYKGFLKKRYKQEANVAWRYANALKGNFFNLSLGWLGRYHNPLFRRELRADNVYESLVSEQTYTSHTYSISGRVSHSFDFWRALLSLKGACQWQDYAFLRGQRLVEGRLTSLNLALEWNIRPLQSLTIEGSHRFFKVGMSAGGQQSNRELSFVHKLSCSYAISQKWTVVWKNSFYHNNDKSRPNNLFGDLSLNYYGKGFDLLLSCSNVFNNNSFEIRQITSQAIILQRIELRPRELLLKVSFDL